MRGPFILAVLVLCSCDKSGPTKPDPATVAAMASAAQVAEAQRKTQEKMQIVSAPSSVLEVSDVGAFDEGIFNTYRQLSKVTVLNKSHFALRNIAGSVDWLDAAGHSLGTTPFTLAGSIPAGDTKHFATSDQSMTSGTIQGNAKNYKLTFTHVDVID